MLFQLGMRIFLSGAIGEHPGIAAPGGVVANHEPGPDAVASKLFLEHAADEGVPDKVGRGGRSWGGVLALLLGPWHHPVVRISERTHKPEHERDRGVPRR